jgi:uncharacterized protein (TIGR02145 family)
MNATKIFLSVASILLATIFMLSCSSDSDDDSGSIIFCSGNTHPYGSFTDTRDSMEYKTIVIGTQVWMAQNLNYNDDTSVCYKEDNSNCDKYGRLYNWAEAMEACPAGWRLPSTSDWDTLMEYVQTNNDSSYASGSEASIAGMHLKATCGWSSLDEQSSGNGLDTYGFAALPGGCYNGNPNSSISGNNGCWWSSHEDDDINEYAYFRRISYSNDNAYWVSNYKNGWRFSVRCVQN